MREGCYTDAYFNFARSTLLADDRHPRVVMQVFQRKHSLLGGMDEAVAILKLCSDDWDALTVRALYDGDKVEPWETVAAIEGRLRALVSRPATSASSRRTLIATNGERVVEAARGSRSSSCPRVTTITVSRR